ncbi:hypothetical protein BKA83DRAFT_4304213 [Pisolithus microcarpus]|nr:hypothetical protein BKA83DRAFT_4304213 [Pisolithus microcarpus]
MSIDISYFNLPFSDELMSLSTGDSVIDTSEYQDLEFEVLDPVPPYPPEELLQFADDVLESPESRTVLQQAVQDIGGSAYSIDTSFIGVAGGLRKAQAQATPVQKEQLQGYADIWAVLHKEYVHLLWDSRRVAGHARVIAQDFAGAFLSLMAATDITLAEKKAEISAYRKQLDEDATKSMDLSQRFDELRKAVGNFENDVKEFLKTGNGLELELLEAGKTVAEIKQRISQLDSTISWSIGIALGAAGIALGSIVLGVLCPQFWTLPTGIGALSIRMGMNAYREHKQKQRKLIELKKRQVQLEERSRGLEGMHKIYGILDPLESDIEQIRAKLAVFGQIWRLIHVDLNAVEKNLELANNSAGVALFKRRLQRTSKVYTLLADVLYQYETNAHIRKVGKLGD